MQHVQQSENPPVDFAQPALNTGMSWGMPAQPGAGAAMDPLEEMMKFAEDAEANNGNGMPDLARQSSIYHAK